MADKLLDIQNRVLRPVEEMTDDDLQATIDRLTAELAERTERNAEKSAWLADIAERIEAGYVTADEVRAAMGDKPKRTRKPKPVTEGPQDGPVIETHAPASKFPQHVTFTPSVHVLCTDLDNQYGTPLIPAMCRTTEVLMTNHNGAVKSCITKAYADEAGFRLKGTLIAAGSTNGGVQDSAHRVQCLTDTHCGNRLRGYCMAESTCEHHESAAQKAADEANAPKEEVTEADIDAVLIRGPHVVDANKRILAAYNATFGERQRRSFEDVLKREYGEGGGSIQMVDGSWGSSWHNAKGLRITLNSGTERLLKWGEVATRTAKLIDEGRIASSEVAKEEPAPDAPHRYTLADRPKTGDKVHYVGPNDDTIGVFKSAHGESAPEVKGVSGTSGNVVTSLVPDSAYYSNSLHPEWGVFAASRFPTAVSSEDADVIACENPIGKAGRMYLAEVAVFAAKLSDTGSATWSEGTQLVYSATLVDGVVDLRHDVAAGVSGDDFTADRAAIEAVVAS